MKKIIKAVQKAFWPLYFVSLVFPILAGLRLIGIENKAYGYIDVSIAFLLFLCLTIIDKYFKDIKNNAIKQYKYISGVILFLIVIYFIFNDRLNWEVILIGLGWRMWLLFQVLPYSFKNDN